MSVPRLYVEAELAEGMDVPALPGQGHYLGQVMRKGEGDSVHLFNGRDGEWLARIASIRKDRAVLVPERCLRPQAAGPDIRLLLAPLKRDAMEWVVEKATELGVASIHPVLTARGVVGRVNEARLATIAREAAEQCERLDLPRIAPAQDLHAALDAWDGTPVFIGQERGAPPPLAARLPGRTPPLALLVGPEGGFTRPELDAVTRRHFVFPVGLGPRILRAETAAVAGLAVLQALAGDWTVPS
ncbi:16S rRNA (uracil(1498)-N(3))-methyltransferase [Roseomonas marmotae]|uniref:Ribosomal RNA small subunit methyltransferase E n=1 Tax=Roseomonas marmotae TaxID=2768161 RepID=A0ABS3KCA9_9PROT|nr:16S rRNA (uracil(1498)-N(3))-methyltransferase [Roseomonas marmotae]MBO1075087.1 16S rRNA (uracil(1498)-N(3))-methyltransferase [Roseomonas marmotae]QTI79796.1 16S rRNA (uracil(1498)-N(3))-methyltransferase [Roseomonas marmotae]